MIARNDERLLAKAGDKAHKYGERCITLFPVRDSQRTYLVFMPERGWVHRGARIMKVWAVVHGQRCGAFYWPQRTRCAGP
jgi:hypothetical protein